MQPSLSVMSLNCSGSMFNRNMHSFIKDLLSDSAAKTYFARLFSRGKSCDAQSDPSTERTPLMTSHDSSPLLTQASGVKDRRLGCCSKNFVKDGGNFVVSSANCALISYLEGFLNYFF